MDWSRVLTARGSSASRAQKWAAAASCMYMFTAKMAPRVLRSAVMWYPSRAAQCVLPFDGRSVVKRIRVYEYGGPEVLKIEEAEDLRPETGEVLIRVKAAGVNPYDTYARSGNYGARTPTLPFTPGSDAAGVVEAVGPEVTHIAPGDRVYTSGTLTGAYAELALCKRSQVHPLPNEVSFAQGA